MGCASDPGGPWDLSGISSYTEDHADKGTWLSGPFRIRNLFPPHRAQWPRSEDIVRGTDTQPYETTGHHGKGGGTEGHPEGHTPRQVLGMAEG